MVTSVNTATATDTIIFSFYLTEDFSEVIRVRTVH